MSKCSDVLSEKERAGLDEIHEGVRNREWTIYCTDKSEKIVLYKKENFLKCMEDHYLSDPLVTLQEVIEAEKNINDHIRSWCKNFHIGQEAGLD